jgi:two-component system, OmpR family, heavy metal sensor histidine kinase CusS
MMSSGPRGLQRSEVLSWAARDPQTIPEMRIDNICGDRTLIRRALSNLLSNVIRHTQRGESIRVLLAEEDSHVSVSVINPGDTIPAKHLHRLFDRFYRVDPSRQRHSEGAGLGLAIAKSIIESHGGHIEARSHVGITTFTAILPQ